MYWIASYPRSGNTFLRILLKEVYGIHTWEGYGNETPSKVFEHQKQNGAATHTFIKTHELPSNTEIPSEQLKAIYLYRDGRDTAVSSAHHRSNIVNPNSNYLFNLRTVILAPFNTSFGGWSKHVEQWSKIAIHSIKFEDLTSNPKSELQKLEKTLNLPAGDYSKIPTFQDLKAKKFDYGSGDNNLSERQQQHRRKKFFRSGKVGEWKQEIPQNLQDIFHHKNHKQLETLGYTNISKPSWIYFNLLVQYTLWFKGYITEKLTKS